MLKLSKKKKAAIVLLGSVVVLLAFYLWWVYLYPNYHTVVPGKVYRSGQLYGEKLTHFIERDGIRSVINLRGETPEAGWWRNEVEVCDELDIDLHSRPWLGGEEPTVAQMEELAKLMSSAPKPLLIHCKHGADRTGLAVAIYLSAVEGKTREEARKALAVRFGHVPLVFRWTGAMDRAFESFAKHSP